jgi:hypothetical protein
MPRRGVARPPFLTVAAGIGTLLLVATAAAAQPTEWSDRAYANVSLAFQLTARPFDDRVTPVIYTERALIAATHPVAGRRLTLDTSGGIRLWRNVGAGAALTKFAATDELTVVARVPHPALFNQPRTAAKAAPFQRAESAIHVHAVYVLPIASRFDVMLSGGPSFIRLQQDLVEKIEVAEAGPPFSTVAIGNVGVVTRQVWTRAIHGGADVTWFLTPVVGFGFSARYVKGSAATQLGDGTPIDVDVGGLQIGWGARIRLR